MNRGTEVPNLFKCVVGIRTGNGIQIVKHCGFIKRFALLASIVVAGCINAGTSFAQVQYVKICTFPGAAGFFYIPGIDSCAYGKNLPYVYTTAFGTFSTQPGTQATAYGTNAFANGTGSCCHRGSRFLGGRSL